LHDYRVAYVFGEVPLQQYLIEFPGGRLQTLAQCWDTHPAEEGGQRWFHVYGDEPIPYDDVLHWTGPNQNWNYMCAECHSTDLRKNYDPETDSYATSWEEIDVSCEACHGPGSRHVAWAEAVEKGEPAPEDPGTGLIVRLKDLDEPYWSFDETGIARRTPARTSDTQVEACGRCHSRRSVSRDPYHFGQPLLDTHRLSLLEPHLYHPDGQILEEVYVYGSFLQSRMYLEGVTCSDCHDAHSMELVREGDALCASCHLPAKYEAEEHHHHEVGTEGSGCVDCHMRFEYYMVVDPRHDHSMRVPRPDLSAELGTPDACTDCHADKGLDWSVEAFAEWYPERIGKPHYGQAIQAGRDGSLEAPRLLAELIADREQPGIVRATAMGLFEGYATAGSLELIEAAATDADPLVRTSATHFLGTLSPEARAKISPRLLRDAVLTVRTTAARTLLGVGSDQLEPAERAALEPALEDLRQTHLVNLDRSESRLSLGALHAQRGEMGEARAQYESALALDPGSSAALINLADLARAIGDERQAGERLRQALELDPRDADAHHALGLWFVRQGRLVEALPSLARAAELAPESPRYAYVQAVAMWSGGDREGALSVLEQSQVRRPADRATLMALVGYHLEAANREAAERYGRIVVELYPRDPEVRQMGLRLFGQ
jgi:tetratricopeptide (TPR) repeat protein